MEEELYKVLCRENGKLYSAIMHGWLRIEYIPNQWVRAPVQGLYCFTRLYTAREMLVSCAPHFEVWEVEGRYPCEDWNTVSFSSVFAEMAPAKIKDMIERWRGGHVLDLRDTAVYKEVKLLRRVDFVHKIH